MFSEEAIRGARFTSSQSLQAAMRQNTTKEAEQREDNTSLGVPHIPRGDCRASEFETC